MMATVGGTIQWGPRLRALATRWSVMAYRNLLQASGEVGSALSLMGFGFATPLIVEAELAKRFGVNYLDMGNPAVRAVFQVTAGVCIAVGIAQLFSVVMDNRWARTWVAKSAAFVWLAVAVIFGTARFVGVASLATGLCAGAVLAGLHLPLKVFERDVE